MALSAFLAVSSVVLSILTCNLTTLLLTQAAATANHTQKPAPAHAAAAPKRKPAPAAARGGRKKMVVSESEEEDDVSLSESSGSEISEQGRNATKDVYEMEAFSPAVAPKVRS